MSEAHKAELSPGSISPLEVMQSRQHCVRSFQKCLGATVSVEDRARILHPGEGAYNSLIAGFYEEAYPYNQPADDVLAYDIYTMQALVVAAENAFSPDEAPNGRYTRHDALLLSTLMNGRGVGEEDAIFVNSGYEINPVRVRSGMCYEMRRVAATVAPLQVERTFYGEHRSEILAGIQNLTGLTDAEVEHTAWLVDELRPSHPA